VQLKEGQVAVVTGGASGIGLALCEAFAERGLNVVVGDLRADALGPAVEQVSAKGTEVLGVEVDVRSAESVEHLAVAAEDRFGKVNVICNNAGVVGPYGPPMWEQTESVWRWEVDVMLFGVVYGVRSFVPRLIEAGEGHVLNTASMGGLMTLPGLTPYNAVKHAVVGLTETLRLELATHAPGVGATVLCPSFLPTGLGENSRLIAPEGVVLPEITGDDAAARSTGLDATEVAAEALAGIEADTAHVICYRTRGEPRSIRGRVDALLADLRED